VVEGVGVALAVLRRAIRCDSFRLCDPATVATLAVFDVASGFAGAASCDFWLHWGTL